MSSWQAIWQAPVILLLGAIATHAQPAKTPVIPAVNTGSAQIIPVSLTNDQVAAVVNGEKILIGDVRKILDKGTFPNVLNEEVKKELRKAALDVLVEDIVVRQYLTKHVPQVSQADYNKEYDELLKRLEAQGTSMEAFLAEPGQSKEQVQRDVVAKLQWKTLLTKVYPDEKLKDYYETNKPFFDKIFVQASHILIKLPANPTQAQRAPLVQQLLVWRQDIIAGKVTFEEIVKKHSECPSKDNKDKPGDIGQFPLKFVVLPEFSKAAFAMKKGEISDVVQSVSGLHLILVTDRTVGMPSTFDAMKEAAREAWATEDDLYQRVLTEQLKVGDIKKLLQ